MDKTHIYNTVEKYDKLWRTDEYNGFSRGTLNEDTTPLLEEFIKRLAHNGEELLTRHKVKNPTLSVIEAGAGEGHHAIRLAREDSAHITAVDASLEAITRLESNLRKHGFLSERERLDSYSGITFTSPFNNSRITTINDEIVSYLDEWVHYITQHIIGPSAEGSHFLWLCDGFYSNALFHVFKPDDRVRLYKTISEVQPPKGIIAVAFKAQGDALQYYGKKTSENEYGIVVKGQDEIEREFVKAPEKVMYELKSVGYKLSEPISWVVPDYNKKGKDGKFIGFIGEKLDKR